MATTKKIIEKIRKAFKGGRSIYVKPSGELTLQPTESKLKRTSILGGRPPKLVFTENVLNKLEELVASKEEHHIYVVGKRGLLGREGVLFAPVGETKGSTATVAGDTRYVRALDHFLRENPDYFVVHLHNHPLSVGEEFQYGHSIGDRQTLSQIATRQARFSMVVTGKGDIELLEAKLHPSGIQLSRVPEGEIQFIRLTPEYQAEKEEFHRKFRKYEQRYIRR